MDLRKYCSVLARGTQRLMVSLLAAGAVALPAGANINIADAPLFTTSNVPPNVLFILDDSGSMHWETMPDELTNIFNQSCCDNYLMWTFPFVSGVHGSGDYGGRRIISFDHTIMAAVYRTAAFNTVYYNPAVTYEPWRNADGSLMPTANAKANEVDANPGKYFHPSAARNNPVRTLSPNTRDLTADQTVTARWMDNRSNSHNNVSRSYYPALYYTYNPTPPDDILAAINNSNSPIWTLSNYTRTEIRSDNAPFVSEDRKKRKDCANWAAGSCTYEEEIANFANWYTYHRNRIFASRAGIGAAFAEQPEEMRVGYGTINASGTSVDGRNERAVIHGVRPFDTTTRNTFFKELYQRAIPAQGTPLRAALQGAGEYYRRTDAQGPWSTTPGQAGGEDLSCRQSYTILMTDGYWNGTLSTGVGNADNTEGSMITGPGGQKFQYKPTAPFNDGHSNTLADVAMHYWKNDLRPDLPNRVPTSSLNPAFWQHMITFGVGLGVRGTIDPKKAFATIPPVTDPNAPPPPSWPNPSNSNSAKIDDLLHAAVNSRGGFFSAMDAQTFAEELLGILKEINNRVEASSTSAAASSAVLQAGTTLYTTEFRSSDWSGTLKAFALNADDGSREGELWNAEKLLASLPPENRNIIAGKGTTGAASLAWGNLSESQQDALNHAPDGTKDGLGAQRVSWLRGVLEAHAGFRSRTTTTGDIRRLGDIVNSNPQFVDKDYDGWTLALGAPTVRTGQPDEGVIYVGANDGMLHAFHGGTGQELFAFMPGSLLEAEPGRKFSPLSRLMEEEYSHRYYVDGTPFIEQAYLGGGWKTILLGTLGSGGRSVFALDVSNPETFGPAQVMWEFTDEDLGYNVGQPQIARLKDGTWVALFGNGYNSNSHQAVLYVVNLNTGKILHKISTGVGTSGNPNGLAAPMWTHWPALDLAANQVYAGDLQGNLWRFDLTDPAASPVKLFTATDSGGQPQPITSAPALALSEDGEHVLVAFGTGSYFRVSDGSMGGNQVQSLYGILDKGVLVTGRDQLLQQEIIKEGEHSSGYTVRQISDFEMSGSHQGWFIDLDTQTGERVLTQPTFPTGSIQERIRFATMIPDYDPCGSGRRGFLMDIDLFTGGRFLLPVFDLNRDDDFDSADEWDGTPPSGVEFGTGSRPTVVNRSPIDDIHSGDPEAESLRGREGDRRFGRQSWMQIR